MSELMATAIVKSTVLAISGSKIPSPIDLIPKQLVNIEKPSRISTTAKSTVSHMHTDKNEVVADNVTRSLWSQICLCAAEGEKINDILKKFSVKQVTYRAIMREDKACQEQMMSARADWDNRNWPEELIEEICLQVAMGKGQKAIAEELNFNFAAFHSLRMRDDYVDQMFLKSLKIQAEGLIDEATEIADDDGEDMGQDWRGGDKPNTAAVARSNLKVKQRQWQATKLLSKVYGDVQKVEADINVTVDHAARLDEARKRKERAFHELKDVN